MARPKVRHEFEAAEPEPTQASERRRAQIAAAAIELFSEKGYFQTTIDDIANEIGIGKGLIYRYFKDKNDVLLHALCAVLEKYVEGDVALLIGSRGPLAALQEVFVRHCTVAHEHTDEVALAYRSTKDLMPEQRRHVKALESRIVGEIRRCLEACIRDGLLRPADADIMAYQILMFGHTWALKQWALRKKFSLAEFVAEGERLLIVPFLTPSGAARYSPAGGRRAPRGPHARTP